MHSYIQKYIENTKYEAQVQELVIMGKSLIKDIKVQFTLFYPSSYSSYRVLKCTPLLGIYLVCVQKSKIIYIKSVFSYISKIMPHIFLLLCYVEVIKRKFPR